MWRRLTHPNVLSLLGVTVTPPQLISRWMPGDLPYHIKKHTDADRLGLVGVLPPLFVPRSLSLPAI